MRIFGRRTLSNASEDMEMTSPLGQVQVSVHYNTAEELSVLVRLWDVCLRARSTLLANLCLHHSFKIASHDCMCLQDAYVLASPLGNSTPGNSLFLSSNDHGVDSPVRTSAFILSGCWSYDRPKSDGERMLLRGSSRQRQSELAHST